MQVRRVPVEVKDQFTNVLQVPINRGLFRCLASLWPLREIPTARASLEFREIGIATAEAPSMKNSRACKSIITDALNKAEEMSVDCSGNHIGVAY
jgi:hypothetical protein